MKKLTLFTLPAVLALAPLAVIAQSSDSPIKLGADEPAVETLDLGPAAAPAAPAAAPAPAAPAAPALDAGPNLGGELERTAYQSWEVACAKGGSPCVMAQIGKDK
ncbi:MAG: hypothetical protein KTR33_01960, partial [Gammaproteobacteria bacterium]|nr:hypothetical protein [Gammaproteobacteria bacterium]